MSRQASSGLPRKALKFVGFILLLAAIAACFGLLAKEPADAGHLAHYGLRLLLIALCLTGWFWTQAMIRARRVSDNAAVFDGLHQLTAPLNTYLNAHPGLANGLLIVTSAFIDILGLFLIFWSVLGPSMRPFGALLLLFLFRQACQACCALPIPCGMIFRKPGFPSLLVTYDVANDFFFSGHTAIAALGAIELAQISPWLGLAGALIALVEGTTVIILRAHYTMDVLAAIAASWCAFSLSVARNEWGSFQVLVRADVPISGLRLEASSLKGADNRSSEAIRLVLYRQHQLFLDTGTHRNADFKPDGYPDPLIPFDHPVAGETLRDPRLKAIPFELPARETHGFWVDVFASTNAAAGEYQGICQLMAGPEQVAEIAVHLTVWDFALPGVPALETEFGSPAERLKAYYRERAKAGREAEPTDWAAVETECAQVLSDHRLNAVPPGEIVSPVAQSDGSFRIPPERVAALRQFIERYRLNAVQIPHPSRVVKDPEAERDRLRAWLAAFDLAARELNQAHLVFYTYLGSWRRWPARSSSGTRAPRRMKRRAALWQS